MAVNIYYNKKMSYKKGLILLQVLPLSNLKTSLLTCTLRPGNANKKKLSEKIELYNIFNIIIEKIRFSFY